MSALTPHTYAMIFTYSSYIPCGKEMTTKDLPRLTTALRAFANLSIQYDTPSPAEYKELLAKKRKLRAEKLTESENLQWKTLSEVMKSHAVDAKLADVVAILRELLQVSKLIGKLLKMADAINTRCCIVSIVLYK